VNEYKSRTSDLNARLANLQAMLSRFADKEKESKQNDKDQAAPKKVAAAVARPIKPCHLLIILNIDSIRKILHFVHARSLFALVQTCRTMVDAQDDMDTWTTKALAVSGHESCTHFRTPKEAKRLYRAMANDWHSIMETFKWLARMGFPSDIAGTKNGRPLRLRVLETLKVAIRMTARRLLPPLRLLQLSEAALGALFSLMQVEFLKSHLCSRS